VKEPNNWTVPKWPFFLADGLLLGFAYLIVSKSPHPMGAWEVAASFGAATLGAVLGIVPFLLDYRAASKLVDVNALGAVAEKIQNLETLAARIDAATNQWVNVQTQAEMISTGAKDIANRMGEEIRGFSDFMEKINDREKATLRLEAEKLRRGETEWLQVLVHMLDHVFALHAAATRSAQPQVVEQTANLQNACVNVVRRVGLAPFVAAPNEPFDTERHKAVDTEAPPADAVVVETVGVGFTFQGRMLRPALVRLQEEQAQTATGSEEPAPAEPQSPAAESETQEPEQGGEPEAQEAEAGPEHVDEQEPVGEPEEPGQLPFGEGEPRNE
jgi:molecular chaperone GrpE (heat shock protein)